MFNKKNKKTITIEGMHCEHCAKKVTDALNNIEGIASTKVNIAKKEAVVTLTHEVDNELIKKTIANIDFEVTEIA